MAKTPKQRQVILVTGMSGAGRSSALRALEDMGYDAVDNLPLILLPSLVTQTLQERSLAIGVDIRSHNFGPRRFQSTLDILKALPNHTFKILYLDCDDEVLLRRYTETRRRHPIVGDSLSHAISEERTLMQPLKEHANEVIDTSQTTPIALSQAIQAMFTLEEEAEPLVIQVISFSYRRGVPREADITLDARCLPNPYYDKTLRAQSGLDKPVQNFLKKEKVWTEVFDAAKGLIDVSIKGFKANTRSYVIIACGCTGGQHRSVFLAEQLSTWLSKKYKVITQHRDVKSSTETKEKVSR